MRRRSGHLWEAAGGLPLGPMASRIADVDLIRFSMTNPTSDRLVTPESVGAAVGIKIALFSFS